MRGGARQRHRTYALFAGVCIGIRLPALQPGYYISVMGPTRSGPHTHVRASASQNPRTSEREASAESGMRVTRCEIWMPYSREMTEGPSRRRA